MKVTKDDYNVDSILLQKRTVIQNFLRFYQKNYKEITLFKMKGKEEKRREEKRRTLLGEGVAK